MGVIEESGSTLDVYMQNTYIIVMTVQKTANRLGALSLALVDSMMRSVQDGGDLGATSSAALIAACQQVQPPMIGDLAKICGVSHSVMVRTVAQLVRDGLIKRITGDDQRSVLLIPTKAGLARRDRILAGRMEALAAVVEMLDGDDRMALDRILSHLLDSLTDSRLKSEQICRLCDVQACGSSCPSEIKATKIEVGQTQIPG